MVSAKVLLLFMTAAYLHEGYRPKWGNALVGGFLSMLKGNQ